MSWKELAGFGKNRRSGNALEGVGKGYILQLVGVGRREMESNVCKSHPKG